MADDKQTPRGAPAPQATETTPWWRIRMLWLVIGGPLAVVIASFATLGLALRHPDPVLAPQAAASPAEVPAVQARNHAATPQR
ncbi:MAG: hypothetical protein HZC37_06950 [Burkholderiales bacterium]|nr:hypothetical protein [Burkholderiales bacterium]